MHKITRNEFTIVRNGLIKLGWKQGVSICDDSGTGGIEFSKGADTFFWTQHNLAAAKERAGLTA